MATFEDMALTSSPEAIKLCKFWINQGWKFRAKNNPDLKKRRKEYQKRLKYEFDQIVEKGFVDYFLMLSDSVRWAKDNKIPVGPARGSAAASLVCYLLRITEIDPMQFPTMLFARFIDPNRLDLPDVDLDFADDRRDEVRQYLVRKYGADRVGNIGNFIRYRGKNSIDDVARVYRIPAYAAEGVKGLIVERSGGDARQSESLTDTFEMFPKAAEFARQFPKLREAELLEGNYRGLSVHAAGIVISNTPIPDTCAVYTRTKAGSAEPVSVIAYDKNDSEYLGLLKADFLGLSTMGMIGRALDMIGMDLEDLYNIPITEPDTLRAFGENNLVGVFQFEGRATTIVNRDVHPDNFSHLADINALSRPGPLFSGMTAKYAAVKHGREEPERLHPVVDALTGWTYGQIVYQEQVLSIVKDLAGFPIARVGDIRRIISKKLGHTVMANILEEFIEGCRTTHGIKPELSRRIWDFIATSSTYSFNQSHSVSYAMLAFWCVTGNTRIYDCDLGEYISVAKAFRIGSKRIVQYDEVTGETVPGTIEKIVKTGKKPCFEVVTKSFKHLKCTAEHKILTPSGYRELKDLSVGDLVASEKRHSSSARPDVRLAISEGLKENWAQYSFEERQEIMRPVIAAQDPSARWSKMSEEAREAKSRQWAEAIAIAKDRKIKGSCGEFCFGANELPVCEWLTENGVDHEHQPHVGRGRLADFFAKGTFIEVAQHPGSKATRYEDQYQGKMFQVVTTRNFEDELSWMLEEQHMLNGEEVTFEPIVSIAPIGEKMCYDIAMKGPNHNFLANGVVVHNCMYLKIHYPKEFYAASLSKIGNGKGDLWKRSRMILDAQKNEIAVFPPSLLDSGESWSVTKSGIIGGFQQVHGIGPKTAVKILGVKDGSLCTCGHAMHEGLCTVIYPYGQGYRQCKCDEGETVDLEFGWTELEKIAGIGPSTVKKILSMVESTDPYQVNRTADILEAARDAIAEMGLVTPTHHSTKTISEWDLDPMPQTGSHDVVWVGMARNLNYKDYVEATRTRTGREEEDIIAEMRDPDLRKSCVIQAYDEGDEDVYLRINRWKFPELEQELESIMKDQDVILAIGTKKEDFGISIHVHDLVVLQNEDEENESDEEEDGE